MVDITIENHGSIFLLRPPAVGLGCLAVSTWS
jgi:hypothetical protein